MINLKNGLGIVLALPLLIGPPPANSVPPVPGIGVGHDAVILEEELSIEINSSTDAREKHRRRVQVLTPKGVEQFERASVFHAPGVTILSLRGSVTLPSGKILKAGPDETIDVPAMASFELYSDARFRSMRFPGIVPGAIIEYSSEKSLENLFYLTNEFPLQDEVPASRKTFTLSTTSSVPVRISSAGSTAEYSTSEAGHRVTHRWTVHDVPAWRAEPGAPPESDLLPRVVFRPTILDWRGYHVQATTWNGIARFYMDLAEKRMLPGPDVARAAAELTANIQGDSEKARRLFEFVQGKVRYVAISMGLGGWQPHASADVFKYQYGDCKDKATLLIAMLRSVGLEGWPVLILTRDAGQLDPGVPALAFNHAIVVIPANGAYLFLDPTSTSTDYGDLPWADQGSSALVVKPDGTGEFITTPVHPPEQNGRRVELTAYLGLAGNLEGRLVLHARGQRKARLADLHDSAPSDQREEAARVLAGLVSGARLEQYTIEEPAEAPGETRMTFDFIIDGFVTRAGALEIVKPHLVRLPAARHNASAADRSQPVFFPYLLRDVVESRLYLPPGRTLKKLPDEMNAEGPGMTAGTRYELTRERGRNVVTLRRNVSVSRREIPIGEYPAYRSFAALVEQDESRALTLMLEP